MSATASGSFHLVLIDGSGFIFRAFHALPPLNRPDGTPVNAVLGFTNMLAKLLKENGSTHVAVVFDAGRETFRNRIYTAYKAQRPPPPAELVPQFALVREAARAFAVPAVELADWEADDLIAAYSAAVRKIGGKVTIVSSDKDLMQLVGPDVVMLDPIKQRTVGPERVLERFGVPPEKVIEVQALMGDPTDNVPGVPGIGPKTAADLIRTYGDLTSVLAAAESGTMPASRRRELLLKNKDKALLSYQLVRLRADVPLPIAISELGVREADPEALAAWLAEQGFRSVLQRLGLTAPSKGSPLAESVPLEAPPFGPYPSLATPEELASWIDEARKRGSLALSLVRESNAGRASTGRTSELIGIALATAAGHACYVPLRHRDLVPQLTPETALAALTPLCADPAVLKIFHDAKRAIHVFDAARVTALGPLDCTMLISYVEEAGRHEHDLDSLSRLHLGHTPIAASSLTGSGRSRIDFADVPLDRVAAFAAERADVTLRLWQLLRPRLREIHALALYEQVERRLSNVLADMERAGVKIDTAELAHISMEFGARMKVLATEIYRLADGEFNIGSSKQLGEILFDRMHLSGGKRMKTGAWSTDSQILTSLADAGQALPARVLEWRQLQKLKSTYTDALVKDVNPATGRVHTSFVMAGTSTGRLASTEPNLQNIPIRTDEGGRIRRAFIAEPGNLLVSADYSQIELRLLAHVADIAALKESFARGEDIHARTAAEVFGVPIEGMDPMTRRRAKAINFGIIYGISPFGLGRQLGVEPAEAKAYIDLYLARYPGIRVYTERTREAAHRQGYVQTPFGRRCYITGIGEKNAVRRAYAERAAINAPLQGGAADIIKRAMVRMPGALRAAGLTARMVLQVHDELLFEMPEAQAAATAKIAQEVMVGAVKLSVPIAVETGIGRNWAEAH